MKKCHCCSLSMISGIVFILIAILHLVRFLMGWPVLIDTVDIPQWVSLLAIVIFAALGICSFKKCACCFKKDGSHHCCDHPHDHNHHDRNHPNERKQI